MRKSFYNLLAFCTTINATVTFFGLFGAMAWWLDLFSHFHLHMLLCGVLGICATMLVRRKRGLIIVNFAVVLVNAALIMPYFTISSAVAESSNIKLVAWNVHYRNDQVESGIKYLRHSNADILVIAEPTEPWREGMSSLQDLYPFQFHNPECDAVGCAISLLSKHPWKSIQTKKLVFDTPPIIWAQFDGVNGAHAFTVVAVHMRQAIDADGSTRQKLQTIEIGRIARQFKMPFILAGDMNATPMSAAFDTILKETGTIHPDPTWLATWPTVFGRLGIPIDHVLTKDITTVRLKRGPSGGSDHFPIEAMISMP